jgi:hypothetical protein
MVSVHFIGSKGDNRDNGVSSFYWLGGIKGIIVSVHFIGSQGIMVSVHFIGSKNELTPGFSWTQPITFLTHPTKSSVFLTNFDASSVGYFRYALRLD